MKGFLKRNGGDRGMAIITVVLATALVLALFVMAFTNSMIGNVVTATHMRTRTVAECAHGDLALSGQILLQMDDAGTPPALPIWVTVNNNGVLAGEIAGNAVNLAADRVNVAPNITIRNPAYPGCMTNVDIDYLFYDKGGGGTAEKVIGDNQSTAGALCEPGDFYAITAVATLAGASSQIEAAFCKPPI
jgi:hypothetical protein